MARSTRFGRDSQNFELVQGINDFSKLIAAFGEAAFGGNIKSASNFAMTEVLKQAQKNADAFKRHDGDIKGHNLKMRPGDTAYPGYTRAHIKKKAWLSKDKTLAETYVGVQRSAFYAAQFVELGTAYQPAQPFLKPAFAQAKKNIIKRLSDKMDKNIQKEINKRNNRAGR